MDKRRNGPVIMATRFAARPVTRFRNIRHFYENVPSYFAQSGKIAVSLDSPTQNVVLPLSPSFLAPFALILSASLALVPCLSVSLASLLFVSLSRSLASLFTLTALNYVKNKFGPGN